MQQLNKTCFATDSSMFLLLRVIVNLSKLRMAFFMHT